MFMNLRVSKFAYAALSIFALAVLCAHVSVAIAHAQTKEARVEVSVDTMDKTSAGSVNFVADLGQNAINSLALSDVSSKERKSRFRSLLKQSFDVEAIGKFALGRYWRTATPEQRKEYLKYFEAMIVEVYARRFEEYSGETFAVLSARRDGDHIIVGSEIQRPNGPSLGVDWQVRRTGSAYKITDVVVEGVSMSLTQRSDFASFVGRNGGDVDRLIKALKKKYS